MNKKTFKIVMTRTVYQCAEIKIEASTKSEAIQKVLDTPEQHVWDTDLILDYELAYLEETK
jgi:hypothetical protein